MVKVTERDLLQMVIMRGLGFTQEEIARRLGISQNAVSYYLEKFRQRAIRETPITVFWSLVLGPLGAPPALLVSLSKILSETLKEERTRPKRRKWGM